MKTSFAALAAFLLAIALSSAVYAQALPGQPYVQIPIPKPEIPELRPERREHDRDWWQRCEHLREREYEIRQRLTYTPPYGEERERLDHQFREVHYERGLCRDWENREEVPEGRP